MAEVGRATRLRRLGGEIGLCQSSVPNLGRAAHGLRSYIATIRKTVETRAGTPAPCGRQRGLLMRHAGYGRNSRRTEKTPSETFASPSNLLARCTTCARSITKEASVGPWQGEGQGRHEWTSLCNYKIQCREISIWRRRGDSCSRSSVSGGGVSAERGALGCGELEMAEPVCSRTGAAEEMPKAAGALVEDAREEGGAERQPARRTRKRVRGGKSVDVPRPQTDPKPRRQRYVKGGEEDLVDASPDWYLLRDGRRYVKPYRFNFRVNCKLRWVGQTVLQTFTSEFDYRSEEYWRDEILSGRFLACDATVDPDTPLAGHEWLTHLVHRHESPVLDWPLDMVFDNDDVVVVNKPPSIPVHPCGAYRRNSLTFLLASEHNLRGLHTVHRLDKATSGLVILSKKKVCGSTSPRASSEGKLEAQRPGFVVLNVFHELVVQSSQLEHLFIFVWPWTTTWDCGGQEVATKLAKEIESRSVVKAYIARVCGEFPKEELTCVAKLSFDPRRQRGFRSEKGKDAETVFKREFYDPDSDTSVVRCFPKTGRTHQIRIHLSELGHPIENDPIYRSKEKEEIGRCAQVLHPTVQELDEDIGKEGYQLCCPTCPSLPAKGDREDTPLIYLHAEKYSGDGWEYEAAHPPWARREFRIPTRRDRKN